MSDSTGNFLGMSPQFAQNLLNFGASTLVGANARTPQGFLQYGSGALGPIGAGLMGMQQQGMDVARLRGALGLQQAQTQHTQAETGLINAELPMMRQSMDWMNQAMGPGGGFDQGTGGAFGGGGGGFTGNQIGAPANVIPPAQREAMVRNAVKGVDPPAELLDAVVGQETGWDANKRGQKGEIGLAQIMPSTAQNPGVSPAVDPQALSDPQNNLTFAAHYLHGLGQKYGMQPQDWSDPAKVSQVLHDYNGPQSPPQYAQSILAKLRQPPSWAPPPFQIAQAGGGMPPMAGQQPPQVPGGMPGAGAVPNQDAQQRANWYYNQLAHLPKFPGQMGDPLAGQRAALQSQAEMWQKLALANPMATAGKQADVAAAGPIAEAQQQAIENHAGPIALEKAINSNFAARPGSGGIMQTKNGPVWFKFPELKTEVTPSGANVYTHIAPPAIGSPEGTPGTSTPVLGSAGQPSVEKLSPQQEGMLKAQPEVVKQNIEHDRTTVEGDLSHVLDNVIPAKQQLFQLRSLIDQAAPGASGQLRADFKNWVQTFAPDFVSKVTGDASPAQEFNKIALMGAGKQERGDLGARGGFRAIEMYVKANPNLDMQPTANRDMANALLVSHQFHEDYATGASSWYTQNLNGFMTPNNPQSYKPISQYDQRFIQTMRPELYASAISALNGKPYAEWSKGLTGKQMQLVGGILQRTDPNAAIDIGNGMVPVSKFKTTMGPNDIMGGG